MNPSFSVPIIEALTPAISKWRENPDWEWEVRICSDVKQYKTRCHDYLQQRGHLSTSIDRFYDGGTVRISDELGAEKQIIGRTGLRKSGRYRLDVETTGREGRPRSTFRISMKSEAKMAESEVRSYADKVPDFVRIKYRTSMVMNWCSHDMTRIYSGKTIAEAQAAEEAKSCTTEIEMEAMRSVSSSSATRLAQLFVRQFFYRWLGLHPTTQFRILGAEDKTLRRGGGLC